MVPGVLQVAGGCLLQWVGVRGEVGVHREEAVGEVEEAYRLEEGVVEVGPCLRIVALVGGVEGHQVDQGWGGAHQEQKQLVSKRHKAND